MLAYALRRIAWMVPTLLGITLVLFLALHLAPGDLAEAVAGAGIEGASGDRGAQVAEVRARLLLDQPLWRQYLHYLGPFDMGPRGHRWFGGTGEHPFGGLVLLDFGREMARPDVPVASELARRLRVTVPLSLAALVLAYVVAIPLGIHAAVRQGSALERASTVGLFALHSLPSFWAALMLILLLGPAGLDWLPVIGLSSQGPPPQGLLARALDVARHALLPVVVLAYGGVAYLSRQMRAGLIEVLASDYVRTARAKGLPERRVILVHALRNGLLPVITLAGTALPALVAGSIIVESLFDLPGMGLYAYDGLLRRDLNVVLACATLSSLLTLAGMLLSDLCYALADPRIRYR